MTEEKKGRERTADAILAASAAVAAGAALLPPSFGSGLLFHTALAAAVGGAADWFAVHSLFRRPLGIPFRTELLPRSRAKIIRMARVMVAEEILTVPRLYRVLKAHSLAAAFLSWEQTNRPAVKELLQQAVRTAFFALDADRTARKTAGAAVRALDTVNWAALLRTALLALETSAHRDRLLRGFRQAARAFLQDGFTEKDVLDLYHRAWTLYESGGRGRDMLRSLLAGQLGLTDEKAASLIQERIMAWADTLGDPDSPSGRRLLQKYRAFLVRLETDEVFQEQVNDTVRRWLLPVIRRDGAVWLRTFLDGKREEGAAFGAEELLSRMEARMRSETARRTLDRWLLRQVVQFLPYLHGKIGDSVEQALSAYSGREMADLVEKSVWHDLQMIRINGSLIGALLGAASYLAFYFLSGGALL